MKGRKGDAVDKVRENGLDEKKRADRLARQLRDCRNELCYRCGLYREAHLGACNACRYRHGGEWEKDIA